jgi:hypothetical protein
MKLLHDIVARVRSGARGLLKALVPADQGRVAAGAVVDVVRSRRELILENVMLRQRSFGLPGADPETQTPPAAGTHATAMPTRKRLEGLGRPQKKLA